METLQTVARKAPLSTDFPGKTIGAGCHLLLPGIFLTQGMNPASFALAGGFFTSESPGEPGGAQYSVPNISSKGGVPRKKGHRLTA